MHPPARSTGPDDVAIKILYCGMCHTDLHFIRNDWGITRYPVVPGHEITGIVTEAGTNAAAAGFNPGDTVGVGCLAASCLSCEACQGGEENYCDNHQMTYNGVFWDGSVTYGGYSAMIVADRRFVVRIPKGLPLDAAAPLLCAGITVYSPMRRYGMVHQGQGKSLGVVGLGGLGHVAVKFGKTFGMRVTVISTSPGKKDEAIRTLGADHFLLSTDLDQMRAATQSLDFVVDTVSAKHDLGPILHLLKLNGTLVLVGAPDKPVDLPSFPLIFGKRVVAGSVMGGIREMQEMMYLCAQRGVACDVELVKPECINNALERLARNDVRYRFVIDLTGAKAKL